jgi:hypothetical protein
MMGTNMHDSLLIQHARNQNSFSADRFDDIDTSGLPNREHSRG